MNGEKRTEIYLQGLTITILSYRQSAMLVSVLIVSFLVTVSKSERSFEIDDPWDAWKHLFGKTYSTPAEENFRMKVWKENMMKVANHNMDFHKGLKSFSLALNDLADLSLEEIRKEYLGGADVMDREDSQSLVLEEEVESVAAIPTSVDWRNSGHVTSVKHQGRCGSCYAFSAVGAIEGQLANKQLPLTSLSAQQIVDCSQNSKCNGGSVGRGFKYAQKSGIVSRKSYPYTGKNQDCKINSSTTGVKVSAFKWLGNNEVKLAQAVATVGPIAINADSAHTSFVYYKSGIYNEPNCKNNTYNHGMLIVGYGSEKGQDYWIIKNSWGTRWGEKGYIRIVRNQFNHCSVSTAPLYPIL